MKIKGFYDLLLKLDELDLQEYVTSDINYEQNNIKDIDQYLAQQFLNRVLIEHLKKQKTLSDKLNFINHLAKNIDMNHQFSDQILLKTKNQIHDYQNNIRLTDNYLFTNHNEQELINEINKEIKTSDEVNFIYPFISKSMLNKIERSLKFANDQNIKVKFITTTFDNTAKYVNLLELERLVTTYPNIEIRVEDNLENRSERIHIKSSIFYRYSGFGTAIIGSSNLTFKGMMRGREWNIKINEYINNNLYQKICAEYNKIWKDHLVDFNNQEARDDLLARISQEENNAHHFSQVTTNKYLYDFQKEIVNILAYRRKIKKTHHLIIMATGTGKTVVSAFDYKNQIKENNHKPSLLFLAHQKEIIDQALMTFRSVLEDKTFGESIYDGKKPSQYKYIFATIQTIYHRLNDFDPRQFDIIIFDEAHHIAANSFDQVFNYFEPKQVIGLTATPERTDGKSIINYFGNEFTYELRLWDAINQRLLCPFDYYCIDDINIDMNGVDINNDNELFKKLNNDSRNHLLINMIERYIGLYAHPMCIVFCITSEHAKLVSNFLQSKGLRSEYLTSEVNHLRDRIIHNFKNGQINYLCVVNMFNEGIDIPEVNTIIMLRPTNSQTVYLQQLGRGLRKTNLKNKLEVYDLITNIDQKYDISVGIKNLFHHKIGMKSIINNEYLPFGSTITLEKRSREVILNNLKSWINDRSRVRMHIKEFYQKYQANGLFKILDHYNMSIIEFYNMLDDFYIKIGQGINHYKINENDTNRNKNILKQFLFLNSFEIINYFYLRLSQSLKNDEYNDQYDNLLMCSILYEVTSLARFNELFPDIDHKTDIVEYFINHNTLIVNELLLILKYKLDNEVLLCHDNHLTNILLSSHWIFTIKQALCIIGRTNYLPKHKLNIIAFQAGYLSFNKSLVILADVDSNNYGKLTKFIEESKDYYWSLPEQMTINNKLVRDIKNLNLNKFLFLQNKINHHYSNLKIKLYDFIGMGYYINLIDSNIITAYFKVK